MCDCRFYDVDIFHCGLELLRWIESRPWLCEEFPAFRDEMIGIAETLLDREMHGGAGRVHACRRAGCCRNAEACCRRAGEVRS